ncbi:MAG TPA: outer membrane protein transport protein [Thermodesulfovibrionales bacterium]|nr:outer membrane protein transport protein [Thermodesulfovibrionales bacterium]
MRRISIFLVLLGLIVFAVTPAMATNGDNLISVGPISRSMGGVGIAAPQDAISAVFSNPAAMCFGPYCPGSGFDFAGTLFMPKVDAKIKISGMPDISAGSEKKVYAIPAIGLSVPIDQAWRFGIAAYGVSGLGVDYRNTAIAQPRFFNFGPQGQFPLAAGSDTQLQIMKFAPSISFQPSSNFSLGLAVHIDYSSLDLGTGSSFNYGFGAQIGAIYKLTDMISVGATYITPQEVNHKKVVSFDGQNFANLKLESPQQLGLGIAVEPIKDALLLEVDGRWINWADATGYGKNDFDWKDQWVLAVGVQYKPIKPLALRVGYNYAANPVRQHNNFVGVTATGPTIKTVQGIQMPTYYYETFRIIGFPAIVKQHITFGFGYELSKKFVLSAGYTHAFKETISESGTNIAGQPTTLQSTLSEDSVEFGLTFRF